MEKRNEMELQGLADGVLAGLLRSDSGTGE